MKKLSMINKAPQVSVPYEWSAVGGSDYSLEDSYEEILAQKEKFEKFAEILMEELTKQGQEDFLILKHPDLGKWWAHFRKRLDEKRRKREAVEKLRKTLSKDEVESLGLTDTLTSIEKEL